MARRGRCAYLGKQTIHERRHALRQRRIQPTETPDHVGGQAPGAAGEQQLGVGEPRRSTVDSGQKRWP
jgi:hypothetical protein